MNAAPSFQFYPKDVLSDSRCLMMSNEELGAYFKSLCICWVNDGLPADISLFCRLINTTPEIARVVQGCFNQHPTDASKLWHKRFEEERQKQIAWRNKSSEGGKKSAELRKNAKTAQNDVKGGSTTVARVVQGWCNTPSSSPSSVFNTPPNPLEGGTGCNPKDESFHLDANQPPKQSKRERKPAQRNPIMDALATHAEGVTDLSQVTPSAWKQIAKAASDIKVVCPDVTPDEIRRRVIAYFTAMPNATCTSTAIAKHWARCDGSRKPGSKPEETERERLERLARQQAEDLSDLNVAN